MTYAARWRRVWTILAAVGVGFASLQWSPLVVVLDLLVTGTGVVVCLVIYQERRMPVTAGLLVRRVAETVRRSLLLSCCVVALTTLTIGSPALALLAVVLAVVTSPVVVHLRSGRGGSAPTPPPAGPATHPPRPAGKALADLDDDGLFRLWRHMFWELGSQPNAEELARLVALRQSCLDEMARRNPAALRAWLDSGARASGGPERFWRRRHHHSEPGEDR